MDPKLIPAAKGRRGVGLVMASAEPIIVVLGPWCGGTSAVAGALHHLGVLMGTQFDWNYRELHDTWEDSSLSQLCRRAFTEPGAQLQMDPRRQSSRCRPRCGASAWRPAPASLRCDGFHAGSLRPGCAGRGGPTRSERDRVAEQARMVARRTGAGSRSAAAAGLHTASLDEVLCITAV